MFSKKNLYTAFVFIPLLFSACKKNDNSNTIKELSSKNISYGNDVAQKFDLYLPAGRSAEKTKVMVLVHGGGWTSGDKTDFDTFVDTLKKRNPGYAIFNINYRLASNNSNSFPAQENDVKAAIEFILIKRQEYFISDQFVLIGASAGAHLALLHAYKYSSPVKAKAVVSFFGPVDLTHMYNSPANPLVPLLLQTVTGGTPSANANIYQQSSPINFVSVQSPATLLLQGGKDELVSPSQAILLKNRLQSFNVRHEYVLYPDEGHGWTGANLTDSFNKIEQFLKTYLP
jgi:acetyl esterase/lipase